MATAPVLHTMSVDEYLHTTFHPDVDFVDGFLEERHLGERDHARLQTILARLLGNHEAEWSVEVNVEMRIQVSATRFRVPDVCVIDARFAIEQIPITPPLLCVEVGSPEDRLPRLLARAEDFHRMGVFVVWVFHPETRQVWISGPSGVEEFHGTLLTVPGTPITLNLAEAFAGLDRRT